MLTNAAAKAKNTKVSWGEIEKELKLRSHAHKQAIFSAYGKAILEKLAKENEDVFADQSLPGGIGPLLDYMKQLGFYVDVADGKFISPADFGSENLEWAKWLIDVVKERLNRFKRLHETEEGSLRVAKQAGDLADIFLKVSNEQELKDQLRDFIEKYQKTT